MTSEDAALFREVAEQFLDDLLVQLEQPILNVSVTVTGGGLITDSSRVRRQLQEQAMKVDMRVGGAFAPVEGLAMTSEDYSIGRVSRQFFNVQGGRFVNMLKALDDPEGDMYFQTVDSAESVADPADNMSNSNESDVSASGFGNPSSGLGTGALVGIILVGILLVSLGSVFIVKRMRNRVPAPSYSYRNSELFTQKKTQKREARKKAREEARASKSASKAAAAATRQSAPPPITEIPAPAKSLQEAAPPPQLSSVHSATLRRTESDVNSDLQSGWGGESLMGGESMSYAYSLDDGINQEAPMSPSGYSLGLAGTGSQGSVPLEIPALSPGDTDSDVELDLDLDLSFSPKSSSIIRDVTAPPGKLGLVLDTTAKGPVVHNVAPGSPLEGMVWPGDMITSIDGADTRKMSAPTITALMAESKDKERVLTVWSNGDA